jgi:hypothetical protein
MPLQILLGLPAKALAGVAVVNVLGGAFYFLFLRTPKVAIKPLTWSSYMPPELDELLQDLAKKNTLVYELRSALHYCQTMAVLAPTAWKDVVDMSALFARAFFDLHQELHYIPCPASKPDEFRALDASELAAYAAVRASIVRDRYLVPLYGALKRLSCTAHTNCIRDSDKRESLEDTLVELEKVRRQAHEELDCVCRRRYWQTILKRAMETALRTPKLAKQVRQHFNRVEIDRYLDV